MHVCMCMFFWQVEWQKLTKSKIHREIELIAVFNTHTRTRLFMCLCVHVYYLIMQYSHVLI